MLVSHDSGLLQAARVDYAARAVDAPPIDLSPDLERRLDGLGLAFLARFYEAVLRARPDSTDALIELGHVYTKLGRLDQGLGVDERLVRLFPEEPTVHYNLACSLALLGRRDAALDALERAIELGYEDARFMQTDADLASIAGEARFARLLARIVRSASDELGRTARD